MLSKTTTEIQELQAIAVLDIVEKEERRSIRKARSEVHAITRENFDVIRSDLSEYPCQCRTLSTPHARHASCLVTLPLPLPTNHLSSHRLYLPIAVMSSQLDVTLAHACDALRTGRYPSFRATAKAYSLTESTLRRRYQNLTSTRTDAATSKRSITP